MGVGSALVCVLLTCFIYQVNMGIDIAAATMITGIVCTARLLLCDHTNKEIYSGLFIGAVCQLIGYAVAL